MVKIIWIALMLSLLTACSDQPQPEITGSRLWNRGRVMYKARCTSCHNANPDLPGSVGPALRGASEELIRDRLTNGKGGMPIQKDMVRFVTAFREYLK